VVRVCFAYMSTHQTARRVFVALILLSLFLLALVVRPFAEAFIFAAVLAGTLWPFQMRLTAKLRGRSAWSAGILCFAVIVALIAPIGGIGAFVVKEVVQGARFVSETVRSEGMQGLIDELPRPARRLTDELLERLPIEEEALDETLQKQATAQGGKAATVVTSALAATGTLFVQGIMMLIALFFLLVDGHALVAWIEDVAPLEPGQASELMREFRKVSVAVLVSSIATSGVQSAAALIGYLIARVPHPFFFATVTFFVAFIPAIGAGGVCLAAALILFVQGKVGFAIFLAVWGFVVVGLVDNLVKPLLVKRGMHMHGAIVFFALLGGLAAFGTVGLLLGPLIVTFFLALVRIYQRDFGPRSSHPPPRLAHGPGLSPSGVDDL
jgi:predicted PurR-regulated permease PerM